MINHKLFWSILFTCALAIGCSDDDDPPLENEEEIITDVELTFTPATGSPIVVTAQDPDGEGPQDIAVSGSIELNANTTYTLTVELENSIEEESITEEIKKEADEHMFFFGWTDGLFTTPSGDGNIDNRADAVAYGDVDVNSLPLGLETTWVTGDAASGTFRIVLKHQPDIKSATSTSSDGESDIDLSWDITIQ